MSPEGESIKPDEEDEEDLGWDKTEGDETSVKETDDEGGVAFKNCSHAP